MTGTTNALLSWSVDAFIARLGRQSEEFLLFLDSSSRHAPLSFFLFLLSLSQLFLGGGAALGVARAFFAALVLALDTDLVGAVLGAAVVAGAVYAHANGSLHTLCVDGSCGHGNPFMGL